MGGSPGGTVRPNLRIPQKGWAHLGLETPRSPSKPPGLPGGQQPGPGCRVTPTGDRDRASPRSVADTVPRLGSSCCGGHGRFPRIPIFLPFFTGALMKYGRPVGGIPALRRVTYYRIALRSPPPLRLGHTRGCCRVRVASPEKCLPGLIPVGAVGEEAALGVAPGLQSTRPPGPPGRGASGKPSPRRKGAVPGGTRGSGVPRGRAVPRPQRPSVAGEGEM